MATTPSPPPFVEGEVLKARRPYKGRGGGGWTAKSGYRWLYVAINGRRVARLEHRVVMERHLGRSLEPWELVHHKNGDKADNSLSNLEVMTFGEHTIAHHTGARKSEDSRRIMEAFALLREELRRERSVKSDLLAALEGLISEFRFAIAAVGCRVEGRDALNVACSAVIAAGGAK